MGVGLRVGLAVGVKVGLACGIGGDPLRSGLPPGFVIGGQSNAKGVDSAANLSVENAAYADPYAAIPMLMQLTIRQDPITWRYYDGSAIHGSAGVDNPPSTFGSVAPFFFPSIQPDCVGPELSLSRELDGSNIERLVKFAASGSSLSSDWLNPAYPAGGPSFLSQFYSFIDSAGIRVAGVFWNQGEHDANNEAKSLTYAANMEAFWDAFFDRYGRAPLIIAKLNDALTVGTFPYRDNVRAQQVAFASRYPWTTLVDLDDLELGVGDSIHYGADQQIEIGKRVAAAYVAAIAKTSLTAAIVESADPLQAGGTAFAYTVTSSVQGPNDALNLALVVTLPAEVGFADAAGDGWTCSHAGGVVTCTRASGAVGAQPAITINCTAPGGVGSGSMTSTLTAVASNAAVRKTASQATALTAPPTTIDSGSGVYLPQTAGEYQAMITGGALEVDVPDEIVHLGALGSGNAVGVIAGWTFAATGTSGTYNQPLTGWTAKVFSWINAASHRFVSTDASLPDIGAESLAVMMLSNIRAAPTATRGIMGAGTTTHWMQAFCTNTPRLQGTDGANGQIGTADPRSAPAVRAIMMQRIVGAPGTGALMTDQELLTYVQGAGSGKQIMLGTAPQVLQAPPMGVIDVYIWRGAKAAAITPARFKALVNHQGRGYWNVPWSPP